MRWLLFAVILSGARPARAVPPVTLEQGFGATNVGAVAGNGALTAGISPGGTVTMLAWPGPSFANQMLYLSSNAPDARSQPHFGAADGMGSFLGLKVTLASGDELTWLRDAGWTRSQSYAAVDAPVPVTRFDSLALGLTVTVTDVVLPDTDVLTRLVQVQRHGGSPVTGASLVVYENLSPTLSRIPEVPVADWLLGARNDFVAVWDATDHAVVHFHPGDRATATGIGDLIDSGSEPDYGAAGALMKQTTVTLADAAGLVSNLDADYPPGVTALVTTEPAPTSFQVGSDATPFCDKLGAFLDNIQAQAKSNPQIASLGVLGVVRCKDTDPMATLRADQGWHWQPEDALAELGSGALQGSPLAAGQTNAALVAPLSFQLDTATAAVDFAFGSTLAQARAALATAETQSPADRVTAELQAARAIFKSVRLPSASLGSRVVEVAERALVNLYVARDRKSGALLASVTRQPPYYLDWPRDGAFDSIALDIAGLGDWVTERDTWYATLQRQTPAGADLLSANPPTDPDTGMPSFPAGAWEMNYFADGAIGGPIRFEIDNTALHSFATVVHVAMLAGAQRTAFAKAMWPSDKAAFDLLLRWRDPSGLPAPANEDDHTDLTSTLDGAAPVYAALVAGARLAHFLGDDADARRYLDGSKSLGAAILKTYFDPTTGLFREKSGEPGGPGGGATAWLVWPGRLLDRSDPRMEKQLEADMGPVLAALAGKTDVASYLGKTILSAALYGSPNGARAMARHAVEELAEVARPGTDDFGEVFVTQPDANPRFVNEVATPHVWEGILFYLSAMALTDPAAFTPEETVLPLPGQKTSGCGCASPDPSDALLAIAVVLEFVRRRPGRRRYP